MKSLSVTHRKRLLHRVPRDMAGVGLLFIITLLGKVYYRLVITPITLLRLD